MRADRGRHIYNSGKGRGSLIAGWKEYRSLNEREFVPRAPSPRRRSVGPSRLIQAGQGAKSLDATSRWCRPPSMAGEQGWSGAAMRANLDVKRETQRASAGAHRVACFESPSCLLQPTWGSPARQPWFIWGHVAGRHKHRLQNTNHKHTHTHTHRHTTPRERGARRERSVETTHSLVHREGQRQTERESSRRPRDVGAEPRTQSSGAPHLTQHNPAFRI